MKPEVHDDFVDAVQCLTDESCDFVIVGAHALAVHGAPRATGDLDIHQLGLPPGRIDILTEISGVSFDEAVAQPVVGLLGHVSVRCIGLDALLENKRATGRTLCRIASGTDTAHDGPASVTVRWRASSARSRPLPTPRARRAGSRRSTT